MQTDVLLNRLYMRVEPSDSSYMPSLVVLSGGDSIHSMKELKTVNIGATETLVTLLQDLTEVTYHPLIYLICPHSLDEYYIYLNTAPFMLMMLE